MQILAVSDIHGDLAQMTWIAEQEPGLLLIAGDLAGRHENRREVADWLKTLPFPVAICSGNHDWDGGIQWLYRLRNKRIIIDSVGFISGTPVIALPWPHFRFPNVGSWRMHGSAYQVSQIALDPAFARATGGLRFGLAGGIGNDDKGAGRQHQADTGGLWPLS